MTPDRLADALIADIDSKNKIVYDMIDIRWIIYISMPYCDNHHNQIFY